MTRRSQLGADGTSVVSSIRLGLLDLLALSVPPQREAPPRHARPSRVADPVSGERLPVAWVLQTLSDLRPRDSILVEEAPSARPVMHDHLPIFESQTFYTMCSGGLGYGLPAAVGVAMGRPGTKVIGLIGDGSAMYAIQALWSAAQMALPVAIVILKNRRYAALHEFAGSSAIARVSRCRAPTCPTWTSWRSPPPKACRVCVSSTPNSCVRRSRRRCRRRGQ